MSRRALVLDGLWYCLCPSFSVSACNRPISVFSAPRRRNTRPNGPRSFAPITSLRRCYSSDFPGIGGGHTETTQDYQHGAPPAPDPIIQLPSNNGPNSWEDGDEPCEQETKSRPAREEYKRPHRVPENFNEMTNEEMEQLLENLTAKSPTIRPVTHVLRTLVRDRHVHPGPRHYRALMLANTDARRGTPDLVRDLFREMDKHCITADSATLHAALQALAVHPDYLLRQAVLHRLRDRWLPLSPAGWHFVVAGLLRDHQFELALEQLSLMERKEIPVENWLRSLIYYTLSDFGEFDEVHRLMCEHVKQNQHMTHELLLHVLYKASDHLHYETTRFIWQRMVELGHIQPPYKICSNVLTIASRHGDAELGSSVFRYLIEREMPLCREDYERLVDANVRSGDMSAAFELLCMMHENDIAVEERSTQAIREYIVQNRFDHREAWQILKRLKHDRGNVPIGCVQSIADVCDELAAHDPSVVDDAVGFYKELYTLCPEGADVSVYNSLIHMCRRAKNREAGMFLVKEMASLGVVPNGETFAAIILMCLEAGNFQSAYMYFLDLVKRDLSLSDEARDEISSICATSMDEYAMQLQYHHRLTGKPPEGEEEVEEEGAKEQKKLAKKKPKRHWLLEPEERRKWNKERRKAKRRRLAIARNMEEEGWMDVEAGGLEGEPAKSVE